MKIDPSQIETVLRDCLFDPAESTSDAVVVEGIRATFHFHPRRLESHAPQIQRWLMALPHGFRRHEGGGWTFLNACMDEDGNQWGEHRDMDVLFSLGLGLGLVKPVLPREMWDVLPGGMPYYVIEDQITEAECLPLATNSTG